MLIFALVNLKGGVGKSTLALNLACELATRKRRVRLVDADEQGTCVEWAAAGLLPVACDPMPISGPRDVQTWARRVVALDADYIVVDCAPRLAAATEAAVAVADTAVVPVGASGADLAATTAALELIAAARRARRDGGPKCLLVPSRVDRRTASGREIDGVLEQLGETVGPAVHQRAAMVDAFSAGQWIGQYAPGSAAHGDIQALASRLLSKPYSVNRQ